ncbi:DUF4476 domain-containing protein [Pontibacter sp. 172403-2]|uniref:DUF4476 domain-containing protein n=1 Tax=Pontibacter rufus TaxID=2791028 RepID=UPI0018AFF251|nr:DUF4476 domain-containing protein [Pontibacter sp. 172403-2]MBF9253175.1 DUF4476 domain-containing protein [Pontibacter sp. 172403-2]
MKKYLLPLLLVLLVLPVLAQASVLTLTAERGEAFVAKVNGRTINYTASKLVRLDNLRPGKHYVELKVRSRHGMYKLGQEVFVPVGAEVMYGVRTLGRSGKAYLRLLREVPLVPPVVVRPAPPMPRYPDRHDRDYGRHDRYDPAPRHDNDDAYCRNLMSSREVDRLLQTMDSRDFENTKLSIARDAVSSGSIRAEDLKRLLQQFDYESMQVEFAKFAYEYVCDKEHFYYIYDLFRYDSSVQELERYSGRR